MLAEAVRSITLAEEARLWIRWEVVTSQCKRVLDMDMTELEDAVKGLAPFLATSDPPYCTEPRTSTLFVRMSR